MRCSLLPAEDDGKERRQSFPAVATTHSDLPFLLNCRPVIYGLSATAIAPINHFETANFVIWYIRARRSRQAPATSSASPAGSYNANAANELIEARDGSEEEATSYRNYKFAFLLYPSVFRALYVPRTSTHTHLLSPNQNFRAKIPHSTHPHPPPSLPFTPNHSSSR